jgi:hypothetical protein
MNKRQTARRICKVQLAMGRKILRTKTRKAATALLKKVPHMRPGDQNAGLKWWKYIQMVPAKMRPAVIKQAAKPMLEQCIQKYSD